VVIVEGEICAIISAPAETTAAIPPTTAETAATGRPTPVVVDEKATAPAAPPTFPETFARVEYELFAGFGTETE